MFYKQKVFPNFFVQRFLNGKNDYREGDCLLVEKAKILRWRFKLIAKYVLFESFQLETVERTKKLF